MSNWNCEGCNEIQQCVSIQHFEMRNWQRRLISVNILEYQGKSKVQSLKSRTQDKSFEWIAR